MVWQTLHPVAKIFIWCIILFLIVGGSAYILYIINEALDARDERNKSKASKPIDYTQIDFTYDSKARIKRLGDELREMSRRRKEG